jgi:cell wall-associated NlpC family hydrolase
MTAPNPLPQLQRGDILLYGDGSILSRLIKFRTWSDVSHVEVYAGSGQSLASRSDGPGVYDCRHDGLMRVIRPIMPFDWEAGWKYFQSVDKLPYGWLDLFRFYGIDVPTKGLICSELVDYFFQAMGLPFFNTDYPEGAVCPRDYELISPMLAKQIWSSKP